MLNVLVPSFSRFRFTGGPNTIFQFTQRLAARGVPVRYVPVTEPPPDDIGYFWDHLEQLTGLNIETDVLRDIRDAGSDDVFMATWWPSAYMAGDRFVYFIQDDESMFCTNDADRAKALATLSMDSFRIVNESVLADHLGMDECAVFEPAVDETLFYPEEKTNQLVFYARPNRPRNLYQVGILALDKVVKEGLLDGWDLIAVGSVLPKFGRTVGVRNIPWQRYKDYAAMLRKTRIALSLMNSPHTSYPPLEVSACGGVVVTNSFRGKTANRIKQYAPRSVVVWDSVDSVADGLRRALAGEGSDGEFRGCTHRNWDDAFSHIFPQVEGMVKPCRA